MRRYGEIQFPICGKEFERAACPTPLPRTGHLLQRVRCIEFKSGNDPVVPAAFLLAGGSRLIICNRDNSRMTEWGLEAKREIQSRTVPLRSEWLGLSPDEGPRWTVRLFRPTAIQSVS